MNLTIANSSIQWFGFFLVLGIFSGIIITRIYLAHFKINADYLLDITINISLGALLGARLLYALVSWSTPGAIFSNFMAIAQGGWSFVGAFLGGLGALFLSFHFYQFNSLLKKHYLDGLTLGLIIVAAFGYLGSYFTKTDFGPPTHGFFSMVIPELLRPLVYFQDATFHPTFLYDFLLNLILGILLGSLAYKKRLQPGQLFFYYLLLYPLGRFPIEYLRVNSLYLGELKIFYFAGTVSILSALYFLYYSKKSL